MPTTVNPLSRKGAQGNREQKSPMLNFSPFLYYIFRMNITNEYRGNLSGMKVSLFNCFLLIRFYPDKVSLLLCFISSIVLLMRSIYYFVQYKLYDAGIDKLNGAKKFFIISAISYFFFLVLNLPGLKDYMSYVGLSYSIIFLTIFLHFNSVLLLSTKYFDPVEEPAKESAKESAKKNLRKNQRKNLRKNLRKNRRKNQRKNLRKSPRYMNNNLVLP